MERMWMWCEKRTTILVILVEWDARGTNNRAKMRSQRNPDVEPFHWEFGPKHPCIEVPRKQHSDSVAEVLSTNSKPRPNSFVLGCFALPHGRESKNGNHQLLLRGNPDNLRSPYISAESVAHGDEKDKDMGFHPLIYKMVDQPHKYVCLAGSSSLVEQIVVARIMM
jgi:hypothetical protein